ncbi:MAG TPA: T9SS type A sorting domain-containing protein, partial [Bacteroidia bacterium]|nr:T9SS type A sorting domain-containing protein [Bacteroidia bacterium]
CLTVEWNNLSNSEISVINTLGKEIITILPQGIDSKAYIDISDLASSLYFLQVKTSEGVSTRKIIVQH